MFSHLQFKSCSKWLTHVLYLVWLCSAGSAGTKCTHSKHAYIGVSSTCINHNTALCIQRWESESKLTKKIKQEGLKDQISLLLLLQWREMFTPAFFCLFNQWWDVGNQIWLCPKNRNLIHEAGLPNFFWTASLVQISNLISFTSVHCPDLMDFSFFPQLHSLDKPASWHRGMISTRSLSVTWK